MKLLPPITPNDIRRLRNKARFQHKTIEERTATLRKRRSLKGRARLSRQISRQRAAEAKAGGNKQ